MAGRGRGMVAAAVAAAGIALVTTGTADAAVAYGRNCGAPSGGYDAFGNAAPCTANFHTSRQARILLVIDVISRPGTANIQQPHRWSVDINRCSGAVRPADPPRRVYCTVGAGNHTAYVDQAHYDQRVDLAVHYAP